MAVSQSLTLTEVSYSIADNTSNVRMLWTSTQTGQSHNDNSRTGYYVFNGTSGSVSYTLPANTTTTIFDETFVVAHNSDGTGSVSASTWCDTKISAGEISKDASLTLTTIPRTSSVSCTSGYIGGNVTITINRASANFTHTLTYSFYDLSGTIATKTADTSIKFALPTTFYAQIPNLRAGFGTITCKTYNGSTLIGTSTCVLRARCSETLCAPTINAECYDSNTTTVALTGDNTKFVKYYSNVLAKTNAVAKNYAIIKSQSITIGDKAINGGSGTINNVESGTVTFTVKDSRSLSTEVVVNKTLVEYVKLTCAIEAGAASTSGVAQLKVSGNYWDGNFGAASNTLSVQYRCKTQGGDYSAWTTSTASVTKKNSTYSTTINISGLDYTKAYTFQARAVDKLATVESGEQTRKTQPIFDWGVSSSGAADFNVNGTLKINNKNIVDIIYPVGSIYMSVNSTSPKTLFGGTWVQIQDTFLLAAGTTYKAGTTGGEATHTLTANEMPNHQHSIWAPNSGGSDTGAAIGFPEVGSGKTWWAEASKTGGAGGGAAHNNMPPYLAVYVWKRTA